MPLTANGKLDRKRLPAPERPRDATLHEQPQDACEQRIAAIWSELLKIEMIGRDDDFFVLGGHSLTAVQAVARLRAAFHREVPLRELFAHPSPRSLARYLDTADDADTTPIAVVDRSRPLPPSLAQRRLWFLSQLDGPSRTS
ncbi:phosphopantetheine-binding protein [Xanthomonas arboricola]|uniref:phosphopantetheine-binding protein n=1 Tax=Xanthomonas arboricola TaxID=56448 RepID=UPI0012902C5E|nr:phosphopantetheine-binding protein [Xanthomonas arboricola]